MSQNPGMRASSFAPPAPETKPARRFLWGVAAEGFLFLTRMGGGGRGGGMPSAAAEERRLLVVSCSAAPGSAGYIFPVRLRTTQSPRGGAPGALSAHC